MDRVVVGFDGSPSAAAALRWAIAETRLHQARLTVWTILDHPRDRSGGAGGESAELPTEILHAASVITADVPADHRFGHGSAAAELVRASAGAGMLILGTRGRSAATDLLLGSVSRACTHAAQCPVAIIRPEPEPARPHNMVVVGVDASPHSRRALTVAAEEARLRGAALYAIHAVHWDRIGHGLVAPTSRELLGWGKQLLETELSEAQVKARPLVIHGRASDVLVRHSKAADLLVVGARGRNPLTNLLLGSTSAHCAHHAHSPIIVTR